MIGIYGGTFDPIHTGHAIVASYAAQWGGFDQVWLMVSPKNPLKSAGASAGDSDRLAMARLVAGRIDKVEASDFEFGLEKPLYTSRTLRALSERYPQHRFRLIIGSDNWEIFSRWRDPEEIIDRYGVTVYPRPGYPRPLELPQGVDWLDNAPQSLISSTFLRQAMADGKQIDYLVPECVADYIRDNRLYSGTACPDFSV